VASFLETVRDGRDYLEPFVGGAWVLQEISGIRTASDNNKALVTMYKALQKGWIPPEYISEDVYYKYRLSMNDNDPLTAFIGIGCSFAGKWFGGFIGNGEIGVKTHCSVKSSALSLIRQLPLIKNVAFCACSYSDYNPHGNLIYCDPPYEGTTEYKDKFDSLSFWNVMRKWSLDNTVVISELKAPPDFRCVLSIDSRTSIRNASNISELTTEKLFMYNC